MTFQQETGLSRGPPPYWEFLPWDPQACWVGENLGLPCEASPAQSSHSAPSLLSGDAPAHLMAIIWAVKLTLNCHPSHPTPPPAGPPKHLLKAYLYHYWEEKRKEGVY